MSREVTMIFPPAASPPNANRANPLSNAPKLTNANTVHPKSKNL